MIDHFERVATRLCISNKHLVFGSHVAKYIHCIDIDERKTYVYVILDWIYVNKQGKFQNFTAKLL